MLPKRTAAGQSLETRSRSSPSGRRQPVSTSAAPGSARRSADLPFRGRRALDAFLTGPADEGVQPGKELPLVGLVRVTEEAAVAAARHGRLVEGDVLVRGVVDGVHDVLLSAAGCAGGRSGARGRGPCGSRRGSLRPKKRARA